MFCMGDRTYCASPNCTNKCGRKLTDEEHLRYVKSWGNENYPLSLSYFCGGDILDEESLKDKTT